MTIAAPTFQIRCDEPDCSDTVTLLMIFEELGGFYALGDIEVRYAHWGGETLPDGRHRCSNCKAKYAAESAVDHTTAP